MEFPRLHPLFLLPLLLFSMLQRSTFAIEKSFVVYFGAHSHGQKISPSSLEVVSDSHYNFLASFVGSTQKAKDAIFYSYTSHINGFAATLEEEQANEIAKHPSVVSVFPNRGRQLHTTRSWDFLGLEKNGVVHRSSIWAKARYGEDTIIANLDTGLWPESKSFSDYGYGPIPSKWNGTCVDNSTNKVRCNRKLIGARYFNKGYAAAVGPLDSSNATARDSDGHGTHTLSTAGGDFVSGANVFGYGNGTAKGGSPKARVAAYKVCWPPVNGSECFDADILAAFDAAIQDGVDVISVSLGGDPGDYFTDGIAIGSFHAVKNGIVVVCSAGNSGPADGSVSNVAPWMITVGASTMDRQFPAYVDLGNGTKLMGQSLSPDSLTAGKMYPLLNAADARLANATAEDALLCEPGTLDPKKVKGTILVCLRGINARVDKGEQALVAGAVGMILTNDDLSGNEVIADAHLLPASHITYNDSLTVFAYINSTASPTAYITRPSTLLGTKPAPFMASFSSKGPNTVTPEILKPDITAPGVSIIAAYTNATGPSGMTYDNRRVAFNSDSGTSMSCPHVSGICGLLKTLYPRWSPAAIRSAIMTTATTRDNNKEAILNSSYVKATPFSYGAGHVFPNRAMDPGLVYDLTTNDYLNFLCAIGYNDSRISLFSESTLPYICPKSTNLLDFNYPSITVPGLSGTATVTRTLKNVGSPATYKAQVYTPPGISVTVEPSNLTFYLIGEEKTFKVTLKAKGARAAKDYVFGQLIWSDGSHYVRSPIAVKAAA
ncbi:subtilisin-like protease SBT5.4 [Macadamia integrifolia]|uniref:subtilisin-like protease SBT5.4 n=1 Tax=Macadamia integrifolia TaxID=60698 RepID=UPI001C4E6E96|nr:subtilisin-like protease SBT5.4 [Macadamia integrifolia]XP_042500244.1 subtilisin-like protease SBT5.4 [Macadamia integrifolia]XP_042500245.1 subtilisin-like protease SBT5.4 [Macadamia integrifolia]XP_042500246.1 subtilisin-like protease SBT5.4 [Macadamia integrifolia]XP_042500247.1 subtilisin-like protease SBT5.4 [Macadamia integrifolia]